MTIRKFVAASALSLVIGLPASAADYLIDTDGAHAFVQFRVKHLGFSWLHGRFNAFEGTFTLDEEDPSKNAVSVTVDVTSLDSNHEKRDVHLKSADFLNVETFPEATFVSTRFVAGENGKGTLVGDLTLHGVTQSITITVEKVGEGKDPWGGYRAGFEGATSFAMADFGIDAVNKLGPASGTVEMMLSVEGIRQ
ncbi:MAG: YceI family protein [Pseudomonadota bacterium]